MRKRYSAADRRKLLLDILDLLQVAGADHESVRNVLQREDFSDFEDCLQDECAKQIHPDYIVTRNPNDFSTSDIPAIIPDDLLKVLENSK